MCISSKKNDDLALLGPRPFLLPSLGFNAWINLLTISFWSYGERPGCVGLSHHPCLTRLMKPDWNVAILNVQDMTIENRVSCFVSPISWIWMKMKFRWSCLKPKTLNGLRGQNQLCFSSQPWNYVENTIATTVKFVIESCDPGADV